MSTNHLKKLSHVLHKGNMLVKKYTKKENEYLAANDAAYVWQLLQFESDHAFRRQDKYRGQDGRPQQSIPRYKSSDAARFADPS